jgi:hypothetical protein
MDEIFATFSVFGFFDPEKEDWTLQTAPFYNGQRNVFISFL